MVKFIRNVSNLYLLQFYFITNYSYNCRYLHVLVYILKHADSFQCCGLILLQGVRSAIFRGVCNHDVLHHHQHVFGHSWGCLHYGKNIHVLSGNTIHKLEDVTPLYQNLIYNSR